MKTSEHVRGARSEGPRKLGLCVLCGLPAAGKSTFARALSHRLRQERHWAVGVVAYDDVMPDAFLKEASAPPLPSQWKLLRQELLKYLEDFLMAVMNGCQMSAPPSRTEAMWEDFITCLKDQDLVSSTAHEAQSCYFLTKTAVSRPLLLVLDDNFYYQSMRYELTDLLLTALENPVKYVEDNMEQKETDRIICAANILYQVDQTLRRIVSQTMKEAKDEQVLPSTLKLLAEELHKLKAEFLADLRQGNKKYLCCQQTTDIPDIISFFHYEKDNVVKKYFPKQH
ncbi:hypothetical protein MC885_017882 [Smutsia gigantea]|nr:hypothetical protein MC885_017882 [Smutsia gigantea]